jgi:hypothetical protein
MTDTAQNTPREISIKKGEQIAVAIMAYFVGLEVITLATKAVYGQPIMLTGVVRLALTIVSCFYLYKGKSWAKLLLTFGASIGFIGGMYLTYRALTDPAITFTGYFIALVITIFNGVAAYYLFFSNDLDAFLQNRKR